MRTLCNRFIYSQQNPYARTARIGDATRFVLPLCSTCKFRARQIRSGSVAMICGNSGLIHLVKGEISERVKHNY